ncbi:WcaF family extracellular polysaccharide biosynthesis acetyltransferase [Lutibacter sp. HS1-25]|uniref:WcaF family extracellular polysaccharide biosynthesis acetyltransferase n=1 Tax=Lutibacter sp. HS1-25 TaxID=2485000 RepID=UPI00197B43AB|nr:WcaF family extracellular polysaccharide biosynthesis acetyltransferase [Lutibacter sp. HS1-25]
MKTNLKSFDSSNFNKGASKLKQFTWIILNAIFIQSSWFPFMKPKVMLLKMFGAKIGSGLVIKPAVTIKFPWKLVVGDHVWIGENTWIDNLDNVSIGNNVCISQGAMLLTGNHDYTISSFDYRNAPIIIEDGVWIGAKSVVCPGITCRSHAILAVGSIATKDLEAFTIYQGNPAIKIRERIIKN